MMKYIKKTEEIEVIQLTEDNIVDVINWITNFASVKIVTKEGADDVKGLFINAAQGQTLACFGDYVIREKDGKFYSSSFD